MTKTIKEACEYIAKHCKSESGEAIDASALCESCEAYFADENAAVGININVKAVIPDYGEIPAVATINKDGTCNLRSIGEEWK